MTNNLEKLTIELAQDEDWPMIWEIFHLIIKPGDTVTFSPNTSFGEAKKIWMNKDVYTYKATINNLIVGTYIIKPNFSGLGAHVANGGYMVHPDYRGKKIGYQMTVHSLNEAIHLGFKAMQYNLVVATNTSAVKLYERNGFSIIGTIPKSFNHQKLGYVDSYVMHRFL